MDLDIFRSRFNHKKEEEEAAAVRMPRDGVAQGLEVEAVLATEAAWEQRDAIPSTWTWTRHSFSRSKEPMGRSPLPIRLH
jgi:hypothetical protein